MCLLFSAADFWTIKNICGRIMVGLRWYSVFKDDGSEVWQYESTDANVKPNRVDSTFFWYPQPIALGFWGLMVIFNVLTFSFFWAIMCIINFVLYSVNFSGFYKCRGEHQKKIKDLGTKLGLKVVLGN